MKQVPVQRGEIRVPQTNQIESREQKVQRVFHENDIKLKNQTLDYQSPKDRR